MSERIVLSCAERDATGIPVPAIARVMGCSTWTEWAKVMTRPNPILMGMKWVEVEPPTPDPQPARLGGTAH